jgi:hypothetical protein
MSNFEDAFDRLEDEEMTPAERLESLLSIGDDAPGPRLNSATHASNMFWLRDLVKKFVEDLPAFVNFAISKKGEFGGPPGNHTREDIECDLAAELVLSSMMGIAICMKEELKIAGLGIFRSKAQTVEPIDFSDLDTGAIDHILGMSEDKDAIAELNPRVQKQLQDTLDFHERIINLDRGTKFNLLDALEEIAEELGIELPDRPDHMKRPEDWEDEDEVD